MIGAMLMFSSGLISLWLWLGRIRSYVMRSGQTPVTAASWNISAWGDWARCRQFAIANNDPRGLRLARFFVVSQSATILGFVLMLLGI